MPINDFQNWAEGAPGANLMALADYIASAARANGVSAGIADLTLYNRATRQSAAIAKLIGDFIAGQGFNCLDDGNDAARLTALQEAFASFAGANVVTGAFVNKFRNATALIASRGTSGTVSAGASAYTLDGHYLSATGAGLAWSQAAAIGYGPKALQLSCATGLTDAKWAQPIESQEAAPLAGRVVTVQVAIKNGSGASITPTLTVKHLNASDVGVTAPWTGTPAASTTDINGQALQACPNGATTTVAWTFTADAAFGNGAFVQLDFGGGLNAASGSVTIGDFDIRMTPGATAGLNATPPIPEVRVITAEQAQCQRYLPSLGAPGTSSNSFIASAADQSSTSVDIGWVYSTPSRIAPTGIVVSNPADFSLTSSGGTITPSAITINGASTLGASIEGTITGGAAQSARNFGTKVATASIIFTGAEL